MEEWKTLRRELLLDRRPWLRVLSDDVELPDGTVVEGYLRLETPDYVVIVPEDKQGRIGLVRSYKRGLEGIDIQPPAGMIEADEPPLAAAQRELLEELGCEAEHWQPLGDYVLAGNLRGGRAYLFLALGCREVAEPDSGDLERQEIHWRTRASVQDAWLQGEFGQLGSAAALGLALAHLNNGH